MFGEGSSPSLAIEMGAQEFDPPALDLLTDPCPGDRTVTFR